MCGLVGIVGSEGMGPDPELVRRMRDTLSHRGPDDSGLYLNGPVALGFRRLSIIDLCGGHQPLSNETGNVWTVFNGEIYNFRELKRDLVAKGHTFATQSDTECIVHGYEEYGEEVFSRLNGMFALAIWDEANKRLLLARDRAGEKPLHYHLGRNEFIFGSEIKALVQHPRVSAEIDWSAFDEFASFGFIAAPRSIYRDIRKVLPGHYAVYEGGELRTKRYWNIPLTRRFSGTYGDACEEFARLLGDAVRIRMVSDVPLGAFLSGGLDSSAVVAFMARHSATPIRTFSIGFPEAGYDETGYADLVARWYGTDNTRLVVTPEYKDHIEAVLLNFDEPFGDSSALPTYLVSRLTRQYVTVALSGDGGDELLGGYPTYRMLLRFSQLVEPIPAFVRKPLSRAGEFLPRGSKLERRLRLLGMSENERFVRVVSHFRPADKAELYASEVKAAVTDDRAALGYKEQYLNMEGLRYSDRMQFADFMHYLPDDILVKVDRTSMLVSLETRAPFLDHRLVEFAFSLPSSWKVSGLRSKIILRDALSSLLPPRVLRRGKMGFSVPLREWLAGPLYEYCRSRVTSGEMARLFNTSVVEQLLEDHRRGRRDNSSKLWLLLCFALWVHQRNRPS